MARLMNCLKCWISEYGREKGIDALTWEVRCSDTECAVFQIRSRDEAVGFANWLRLKCPSHSCVIEPGQTDPHWSVVSIITLPDYQI